MRNGLKRPRSSLHRKQSFQKRSDLTSNIISTGLTTGHVPEEWDLELEYLGTLNGSLNH